MPVTDNFKTFKLGTLRLFPYDFGETGFLFSDDGWGLGLKTTRGSFSLSTFLNINIGLISTSFSLIATKLSTSFGLVTFQFNQLLELFRNLSTKIGISLIREEDLKFFRDLSTSIGLISSYFKNLSFIHQIFISFGLLAATPSRLIKFFKTTTTQLGLITTMGVLSLSKFLSTKVGILAVYSDLYGFFRTLNTKVGLTSAITFIWLVGALIDEIGRRVIVGLNEVGRVLAHNGPVVENRLVIRRTLGVIIRSLTTKVGLITFTPAYKYTSNIYRPFLSTTIGLISSFRHTSVYRRILNTIIGITPTKEDLYTFFRELITKLELIATKSSLSSFSAFLIAKVGLTLTKEGVYQFFRTLSIELGLITIKGIYSLSKSLSTIVGLTLTKERVLQFFRTLSIGLGLVSIRGIYSLSKSLSTIVGLTPTKEGFYRLFYILSTDLGLVATYSDVYKFLRTLNINIGLTLTKDQVLEFFRTLSSSIGLIANGPNVARQLIRDLSVSVGLVSIFIWSSIYYKLLEIVVGIKSYYNKNIFLLREFIISTGLKTIDPQVITGFAKMLIVSIGLTSYLNPFSLSAFFNSKIGLIASKASNVFTAILSSFVGLIATGPNRLITKTVYLITTLGITLVKEGVLRYFRSLISSIGLITSNPFLGPRIIIRNLSISIGVTPSIVWKAVYSFILNIKIGVKENLSYIKLSIRIISSNIGLISVYNKFSAFIRKQLIPVGLIAVYIKNLEFYRMLEKAIGLISIRGNYLLTITIKIAVGMKSIINYNARFGRILSTKIGIYAESVWYLINKYGYKILKFLKEKATTLIFKDEDIQ